MIEVAPAPLDHPRDVVRAVGIPAFPFLDERAFDVPFRFDVTLSPNPHVSFGGGGVHFCLGAHLARLTARVFVEELFGGGVTVESAGDPVRLRSNLVNGFARLPVRLR